MEESPGAHSKSPAEARSVLLFSPGCTCVCLYAHVHALVVVLAYVHVDVLADVLLDVLEYVLALVSGASGASAGPFRTCRHFEPAGPAAISNLQPLCLNMYM